jgi:hypothetical protein
MYFARIVVFEKKLRFLKVRRLTIPHAQIAVLWKSLKISTLILESKIILGKIIDKKYFMELDIFIKDSLTQIQKGVKEANIAIAESEGKAVRANGEMQYMVNANRDGGKDGGITFDIAVTVTSEKTTGGGGKVSVVGISVGGEKANTATEQNISRIKFKVDPFNTIY